MMFRRVGGAIVGAALFAIAPAVADASCGAPVASGTTMTVTCMPGPGTISVPDHVGGVVVLGVGGAGGTGGISPYGGQPGSQQGTVTHAGPFTLAVHVGSPGSSGTFAAGGIGGTPGGGNGALGPQGGGGGGGGYTQVVDTTSGTTLMTVGGGGGEGGSNSLGAGGAGAGGDSSFYPDGQPGGLCHSPPESSCPSSFVDGGGGLTSGPGAGDNHPPISGNPGSGNGGGDAGASSGGGGGGGGCFGGGGGGTDASGPGDGGGGGGGGSTCVDASLSSVSEPTATGPQGSVTVTWTPPGTKSSGGGTVNAGGGAPPPPVTTTTTSTGTPVVGVQLGCTGSPGTTCGGQVAVTTKVKGHKKPVVVGKATYTIQAGHVKIVKVKLNATGRKLLKQLGSLKVTVVVKVSTTNGLRQVVTEKLRLKAHKTKKP